MIDPDATDCGKGLTQDKQPPASRTRSSTGSPKEQPDPDGHCENASETGPAGQEGRPEQRVTGARAIAHWGSRTCITQTIFPGSGVFISNVRVGQNSTLIAGSLSEEELQQLLRERRNVLGTQQKQ